MRLSRFHLPTLKDAPADAEVISHQLMVRAGLIRKLAAGIYTLLPLGLRVISKVENIVRDEMNREGGLEVTMPSVQPAELWQESGRWDFYGRELLRFTDRHNREFCYAPTAEEVITDLVRRDVRSYKELPLNFYQIQTKFRDEIRPRFGVMRGREFTMKDAYSFDATAEGADKSYAAMRRAYNAIFSRMGLGYRVVEADTGQIGGSGSHEFMVLAEAGEDTIAFCDTCDYAANTEKVELRAPAGIPPQRHDTLAEVSTPDTTTIDAVSALLTVAKNRLIKTMLYVTSDEKTIVALCRGDHTINEIKLTRFLNVEELRLATDEEAAAAGCVIGYAGPMGLANPTIIADAAVQFVVDGVTGANKKDRHLTGVNPGRDFTPTHYADIRDVVAGDGCPRCADGALELAKGIEVGHIFKLGTKYSRSMKATFLDHEGKEKPLIMGCYGIGIGRTAAAAIEQNHDENGIIWPPAIAPFDVAVLPLGGKKDAEVIAAAQKIYDDLRLAGLDPCLDDRDIRPGVKFADADLIGYPVQVVVGRRGLAEGVAELKVRKEGKKISLPLAEVVAKVKETLAELA